MYMAASRCTWGRKKTIEQQDAEHGGRAGAGKAGGLRRRQPHPTACQAQQVEAFWELAFGSPWVFQVSLWCLLLVSISSVPQVSLWCLCLFFKRRPLIKSYAAQDDRPPHTILHVICCISYFVPNILDGSSVGRSASRSVGRSVSLSVNATESSGESKITTSRWRVFPSQYRCTCAL